MSTFTLDEIQAVMEVLQEDLDNTQEFLSELEDQDDEVAVQMRKENTRHALLLTGALQKLRRML